MKNILPAMFSEKRQSFTVQESNLSGVFCSIDQWHDEDLNNIDKKTRSLYMLDGIHPTRLGYRDWWLPQFESGIEEALKVKI